MTNPEVLRIAKIFFDDDTSSATLRKFAEEHDLNPNCRRKCDLCQDFAEFEFSYWKRKSQGYPVIALYYFGEAVVSHQNCDPQLRDEIRKWVWSNQYGEWSHSIDHAIVANPNTDLDWLSEVGKFTVNGFELMLVKKHPNLTKALEKEILKERGWKRWPKNSLLIDNKSIDNEDEDFESIWITKRF